MEVSLSLFQQDGGFIIIIQQDGGFIIIISTISVISALKDMKENLNIFLLHEINLARQGLMYRRGHEC